ncbi:exopolysaccharide biosynthesis protein [Plasticicumulans acidivorans]|uniref:Exopolysaccharide synthesis protein ExoD n=1 Tax=Plasticicumulans acidivorans TaxID=886464 RepID=A0A317MV43_9GAMM|nr:exopolysaccharide biosynthesis protein [Plasticicumulans acidivorans]PWV61183.1 hypothetical protein C7443_106197 [Plasticicumulans acidivorans]
MSVAVVRSRVSQLLEDCLHGHTDERISLGALLDRLGSRSFGLLLLLFALPNLIPLPPGVSSLFGLPLVLLAAQLACGRGQPWLPHWLRRRSLNRASFERIVHKALPWLRRIENLLCERLRWLTGPFAARLLGAYCLLMALLVLIPFPGSNMLPSAVIAMVALGLLERDGLPVMLGLFCGVAVFGVIRLAVGMVGLA